MGVFSEKSRVREAVVRWLSFAHRRPQQEHEEGGDDRGSSVANDTNDDRCPPPETSTDPKIFPYFDLPIELQRRIVRFLSARDAVSFSLTSKQIQSELNLKTRRPFQMLEEGFAAASPIDHRVLGVTTVEIVIPIYVSGSRRRTHSVSFICEWCDSGSVRDMTVRPGRSQLFIVAHGVQDEDILFSHGRIVAKSGYAPRSLSKLVMSFVPSLGEIYYLWSATCGYKLYLRKLAFHQLMFDDVS